MISSFYEKIVGGSSSSSSSSTTIETNGRKILCVGLACLDIVHVCQRYPVEDSDERCLEYGWQRGGNASNNCTVLSKLGASVEFLGTLGGARPDWAFVREDAKARNIDCSRCPVRDDFPCPVSTVILVRGGGSRTILHHNANLPELKLEDFEKLELENYSWIHFEGRNVPAVVSMMRRVENYNNAVARRKEENRGTDPSETPGSTITMSVELEKKNVELLDLLPYADVAFVSKDFARSRGYANMSETLRSIGRDVKSGAAIVCAWGDRGAMARTPDGAIVQSPAFPPPEIIDTLGAGDTFTAATIYYLNRVKLSHREPRASEKSETLDRLENIEARREITQNPDIESLERARTEFIDRRVLQGAVTFACSVAGSKVGSRGYDAVVRAPADLHGG